jgi:hypothetical protein
MRREISTGFTEMMQNFIHQFALAVLPMVLVAGTHASTQQMKTLSKSQKTNRRWRKSYSPTGRGWRSGVRRRNCQTISSASPAG